MRFIETISVKNGYCELLSYHQARMDYTYDHFFMFPNPHVLKELLQTVPESGIFKFRLVYDRDIREVTSEEYSLKPISSLEIMEADIEYKFKYEDRSRLDSLFSERTKADDILISKIGLITDTYYTNVALLEGDQWKTPRQPLLKGTRRQKLLNQGIITESDIRTDELKKFSKICLFNSMIGFEELELPIEAILGVKS